MQNYGLSHLWIQGDFITRALAIILLIMSILSWTVAAVKGWQIIRIRRLAQRAEIKFWHAPNLEAGLNELSYPNESSPLLLLTMAGKEAVEHHQQHHHQLHDQMQIHDWVARCLKATLDDIVAQGQSGLAILASIGSTAPFVGLFGTVWGIYHALITIGASKQTSIDAVAGPIGEALIMTAFGLFVAIPAVLFYNALARGNKANTVRLNRFVHGLHAYFISGEQLCAHRHKKSVIDKI